MGQRNRNQPGFEPLEQRSLCSAGGSDVLYVGDLADNSVKSFDAATGVYLGAAVAPGAGGLLGPMGMIFRNPGKLLVANQNVDTEIPGGVLTFGAKTGNAGKPVVASGDPDAPYIPRGIVLQGHTLYVADLMTAEEPGTPGRIRTYDVNSGKFLGDIGPAGFDGVFNPRGLAFGPDGDLYASVFDTTNPRAGHVLKFDVDGSGGGGYSVVAANDGDALLEPGETEDLHRPEGLAFGPDGDLYVTSFRKDSTDNDRILSFDAGDGALTGSIDLDLPGQPRAFAQALAFGPGGKLYVPISGNGPDTGSVRVYDTQTEAYTVLVAPGGPLGSGWYLTFGQTNPSTLAYDTKPGAETPGGTPAGVEAAARADSLASILGSGPASVLV